MRRHNKSYWLPEDQRSLMESGLRRCKDCRDVKPLHEFHLRDKKHGSFYDPRCIQCHKKFDAYQHKLSRVSSKTRAMMYNSSEYEITALWDECNGRCMICNVELSFERGDTRSQRHVAHYDHDHSTGKVRGVLCHSCNILLPAYEWAISLNGLVDRYIGIQKSQKSTCIAEPKIGDSILDVK